MHFVYLLACNDKHDKVAMYVGVASNPLLRLRSHNRTSGFPAGNRVTKSMSPGWHLEAVIGPFFKGSHAFRDKLRQKLNGNNNDLHFYSITTATTALQDKIVQIPAASARKVTLTKKKDGLQRKKEKLSLWLRGSEAVQTVVKRLCS